MKTPSFKAALSVATAEEVKLLLLFFFYLIN